MEQQVSPGLLKELGENSYCQKELSGACQMW